MVDVNKMEEQKAKTSKTLATMLDYLGLDAALKTEDKGAKIFIKIASEDAGRIIGRKGQTLESLQLLLNRMMFNADQECPRILLDIDGYSRKEREPRREGEGGRGDGGGRRHEDSRLSETEELLEQQARDAAIEVKRWGESIVLPKMNSHERRIIHITLQDDPEIITESEGDGSLKKVVISLKK